MVMKLTLLWYPWKKPCSYDSPATAPEKHDGGVDGGESSYVSLVRSLETAPEKHLLKVELMRVFFSLNYANKHSWYPERKIIYGIGWAYKCRVCRSGSFSPRGWLEGLISNSRGISSRDFISLSFTRFPANKVDCFVPSTSPSACQAQCVRMI